jgi:hypothetical protein
LKKDKVVQGAIVHCKLNEHAKESCQFEGSVQLKDFVS